MAKHVGNEIRGVTLDSFNGAPHAPQLLRAEGRHVARVGLRQNESPLPRFIRSKRYGDHAPILQQLRHRVATSALLFGSNARAKLRLRQIAGSIEQMRQLVVGTSATPGRGASPL